MAMRALHGEPDTSDFVSAAEYESSAPASFGLPEQPVLYYAANSGPWRLLVVSDGVYLWAPGFGVVYELDQVSLGHDCLVTPDRVVEINAAEFPALKQAFDRCQAVFGAVLPDSVEIAMPADFETGDADDLGNVQLIHSEGMGHTESSGPIVAVKRSRPY